MGFAGCSVQQVTKVTESVCQNFEGNSQVFSKHLFAIRHVWPSPTGDVNSDGRCTSLPFEHLLFPLQAHEAKFLGARKVNE